MLGLRETKEYHGLSGEELQPKLQRGVLSEQSTKPLGFQKTSVPPAFVCFGSEKCASCGLDLGEACGASQERIL
ncbi:hypothetical protein M419DRAFT_118131 [Trichoderma reesei RUT C-30]|uniref:Uncharacterized protein n=1 Tax=Hypocrea jecorina (strain ATCC 56765 / BCRC 32924 / NRRL 11460 / Rut C-30) TaxID=1344414 RepID=A0A024SI57_HYPJR|nr:hypothetical protein M419DRAFT_118131 [Trichoderma reesei RUT C-30]